MSLLHEVGNVYNIQQERIKEKIKSFHRGLFRLSDQLGLEGYPILKFLAQAEENHGLI